MKTDFAMLVKSCREILGIHLPTDIRIKCGRPHNKDKRGIAGLCEVIVNKGGTPKGFRISLYVDAIISSGFDMESVLAHEMVHALMVQNNMYSEHDIWHNRKFIEICTAFEKELQKLGFKVNNLFCADTDTD